MRFSSHFLAVSYPTQSINGILQTAMKNPITYYTFYYLWKILDEFNVSQSEMFILIAPVKLWKIHVI